MIALHVLGRSDTTAFSNIRIHSAQFTSPIEHTEDARKVLAAGDEKCRGGGRGLADLLSGLDVSKKSRWNGEYAEAE